jgi:hypothetical protein
MLNGFYLIDLLSSKKVPPPLIRVEFISLEIVCKGQQKKHTSALISKGAYINLASISALKNFPCKPYFAKKVQVPKKSVFM